MRKVFILLLAIGNSIYSQDLDWAVSMGGTETDHSRAVVTDQNDNVYNAGYFSGTSDFDPGLGVAQVVSNGMTDIYITKIDKDGTFQWVRSIGGTDEDIVNNMFIDTDDNLYISGAFKNTVDFDPGFGVFNLSSEGDYDGYVLKLNSDGEFMWAVRIGGPELDNAYSVAIDGSLNCYISGYFQETVYFNPGTGTAELTAGGFLDLYILKLNSNGDFQWVKSVGGSSTNDVAVNYGLKLDVFENLVLSGYYTGTVDFDPGTGIETRSSNGESDGFILKTDSNGNYLWDIIFGSESYDTVYGLDLDSYGNVHVSGAFRNEMDVDPGAGTFILSAPESNDNAFIIKYSDDGSLIWAKSLGGEEFARSYAMTLDNNDQPLVTIKYFGTVDFDPGVEEYFLTSNGSWEAALVRLQDDGSFYWAGSMGGSEADLPLSVTTDTQNDILLSGYFYDVADYDPGNGVFNLESVGNRDIFLVKITNDILSISNDPLNTSLTCYPNPTSGYLNLSSADNESISKVIIYSIDGKLLVDRSFSNLRDVELYIPGNPGLKLVQVFTNNRTFTFKVVKL